MELALIFLVLVQLVAHVLFQSLLLNIDLRLGGIVVSLLLIILTFDLRELVSESAKLFDFRSQTCLFVLDFVVNLRNESGQVLHRLGLCVVELFLKFRNALDLILDLAVACDSFFLFQLAHKFIDVSCSLFQNLLGSVKNRYFSFDLSKNFLHFLELTVFYTKSRCVLSEVIALNVLGALLIGVLLLFFAHGFFKG